MISIIVPVYKVEPYLKKCIESIINQTYRDIEIILIDDGSPDRCGEICEEYAEKDSRIRVFHTENRGLSAARNYGIDKANGQYIGFVDSDDWIEPAMYEVLLKTAKESGSEVVQCGFYKDYPTTSEIIATPANTYTSVEALQAYLDGEFRSSVWGYLWEKECFSEVMFPEGHVYEDLVLIYKFFSAIRSVTTINTPLYHYVQREGSICFSHDMNNLIDLWRAYKERYELVRNDERFNTNETYIHNELRHCADAIDRTMRWLYTALPQEKENYALQTKEMQSFIKEHLQYQVQKGWPLRLKCSILLEKTNNPLVIPFLYYLNQFYRKCQQLKR